MGRSDLHDRTLYPLRDTVMTDHNEQDITAINRTRQPMLCPACNGPNTGCHLCDGKKRGPSMAEYEQRVSGSRRPDPLLIERICEAVPSVTPNQVADVLRAHENGSNHS